MMLLREEKEILYICCGDSKDKDAALEALKASIALIQEPEIRQTAAEAYQKILAMSSEEFSKLDFEEISSDYAVLEKEKK